MQPQMILIADGLAAVRYFLRRFLERTGYWVLEAADGEEALRYAREHRPDLILMDLSLPVLEGWTASERLKADPATADTPIIALAGNRVLKAHRERARRAGFAACFLKPLELGDVREEIQRQIGSPR